MQKILIIFCAMFIGTAYACESNEIDVLGDGTQCETAKFTITTTELVADTEFKFYMSASGTFYVDWGDGTVDTITRTNTTETLYNHTYSTTGVKTIRFGGLATGYSTKASIQTSVDAAIRFGYGNIVGSTYSFSKASTPELIKAIDGSLGAMFPTIGQNNGQNPRFAVTFARTKIETIPENLFKGVTGGSPYMFAGTFTYSSLKSIPEKLFADITTGNVSSIFRGTFYYCTSLTSIPPNLFSGITSVGNISFYATFTYCSSLSGYVPPSMFAGLIANGSPIYPDDGTGGTMSSIFSATKLATSCPAGTVQFITGYESRWDGRVSCVDENLVCGMGEYLPAHWFKCEQCPENNYCLGGTYTYNGNSQGATQCTTGLFAPNGMWEAAQCGRILHVGDGFVYLRSTKKTEHALHLDLDHDGIADYFGNMTTLDVPMSRETQRKLKVRMNGVVYSIYDDSVDLSLYE